MVDKSYNVSHSIFSEWNGKEGMRKSELVVKHNLDLVKNKLHTIKKKFFGPGTIDAYKKLSKELKIINN